MSSTTTHPAQLPATPSLTPKSLPQNGILEVGNDIQPGEYTVHPTGSPSYWARLSCLTGDGDCILANDNIMGDGYLTILASDVAVQVENVQLTPTSTLAQPTAEPPAAQSSTTDGQGFVDMSGARCNSQDMAAAIGRTAHSLVVICTTGVGQLYYKGMRLSDGTSVEINDTIRTQSGFIATNEGVQYSLSRQALVIARGSTQLANEPMLQYWSN
ncbi:hypothetical protein [Nocardia sp. NPDC051570]|uniref:hypothetical protein n=1 Tax=Nocardia sp. NPDC051570 TaxID=3364324 RepID=UPI00378EB8D1